MPPDAQGLAFCQPTRDVIDLKDTAEQWPQPVHVIVLVGLGHKIHHDYGGNLSRMIAQETGSDNDAAGEEVDSISPVAEHLARDLCYTVGHVLPL